MGEALLRQTLPEQIYRILREDILRQDIPCGSKLTLQVLKDRFGVSHTPIREALTRLVEDGLVNYYSNVGVSVITLTARDVQEIFRLSYDFDYLAIRYAMESGLREDFLGALEDNVAVCTRLLKKDRVEEWRSASDGFHLAFHDFADNSRLEQAAFKLRAQLTLAYGMYKVESQNYAKIQGYHNAIFESLQRDDLEGARMALYRHIHEDMELALERMACEQED